MSSDVIQWQVMTSNAINDITYITVWNLVCSIRSRFKCLHQIYVEIFENLVFRFRLMFKCLHQIETLKYFKRNCKLSTAPSSFLFVKCFYKPEKDSICQIVLVPTICCEIINECKDNKNIFCHRWACQVGSGGCGDQASLHQRKFKFILKKLSIYLSVQERDYL